MNVERGQREMQELKYSNNKVIKKKKMPSGRKKSVALRCYKTSCNKSMWFLFLKSQQNVSAASTSDAEKQGEHLAEIAPRLTAIG